MIYISQRRAPSLFDGTAGDRWCVLAPRGPPVVAAKDAPAGMATAVS
jgi:uncharacterized protein (DUF2237 family)